MANMELMRQDSKRIMEQDSKRRKMTQMEAILQHRDLHSLPEPKQEKPESSKKNVDIEQIVPNLPDTEEGDVKH